MAKNVDETPHRRGTCHLNCPSMKINVELMTRFPGPTRVQALNDISIGSAVSAQLVVMSSRHTDNRTSVTTGRRSFALCASGGLTISDVVKAIFEAEAGAEAELPRPRRGRGSESWERGETGGEAVAPRPRQSRWRSRQVSCLEDYITASANNSRYTRTSRAGTAIARLLCDDRQDSARNS